MPEPLLRVSVLEKLELLALRRRPRSGHAGEQHHRRAGSGVREFVDHRNYQPGDDLRRINWQVYLRSDALAVKLYQDDLHAPTRILLDRSRSMVSGSGVSGSGQAEETKFTYSKRLAAALLYVALVRLESIIVQPFSGGLERAMRCDGGRQRFSLGERYLRELPIGGHTTYAGMAEDYLRRYPTPGVAIVISDFLGDAECLKPLQSLADHGHELWLIHLSTKEDRSPSMDSALSVVDAETDRRLPVSADEKTIRAYTEAFDRHGEALRKMACSRGGRYLSVSVTTPLLGVLFEPMIRSGMMG